MEFQKNRHAVYLLTYHVVLVTKWRRPCISDEIGDYMKRRAGELIRLYNGTLISGETDKDHIHLLIELPPHIAPADVIRVVKTRISREIHLNAEYQEYIEKYIHGDAPLWSPSYFIATTGTTVMEKVKEYIESQRTDEHRRKYVKSGKYKKQA